jgi:YD repeat-containing protein
MGAFSNTMGSAADSYDGDGNRTQLTHPDGYAFAYDYDGLDRLSATFRGHNT